MKKFSTKKELTSHKRMAAAGRALEARLEKWLGRVRKRVRRNETALNAIAKQAKRLTRQITRLETEVRVLRRR
jgi:hypothetical protein